MELSTEFDKSKYVDESISKHSMPNSSADSHRPSPAVRTDDDLESVDETDTESTDIIENTHAHKVATSLGILIINHSLKIFDSFSKKGFSKNKSIKDGFFGDTPPAQNLE